jgi:RecA-family ATPase
LDRARIDPTRQEISAPAIIQGLLNAGDILLLRGTEESFKSVSVVQCAEAIATGTPFLRRWQVCGQRRVGIIETEMHEVKMGQRLSKMFPDGKAPEQVLLMSEDPLRKWRREDLAGKFRVIHDWVCQEDIQVLMIDTANDFFRGLNSPSEERVVAEFFDKLRALSTV